MGLNLKCGRVADRGKVEPGAGRVLHADPLPVGHPAVQAAAHLTFLKKKITKLKMNKLISVYINDDILNNSS